MKRREGGWRTEDGLDLVVLKGLFLRSNFLYQTVLTSYISPLSFQYDIHPFRIAETGVQIQVRLASLALRQTRPLTFLFSSENRTFKTLFNVQFDSQNNRLALHQPNPFLLDYFFFLSFEAVPALPFDGVPVCDLLASSTFTTGTGTLATTCCCCAGAGTGTSTSSFP